MIYLASRSPRRLQLLEQIGISARLLLDEDEARAEALEAVRPGESPTHYVERVAMAKAKAARERLEALMGRQSYSPLPLLAADTTVAIGSRILGKPADEDDAARILAELSGRTHRVLTTVVVISANGRKTLSRTQVSRVCFARLKPEDIEWYVATGEPMGKAGAYGIQGAAARFVRRIEGSYSGIMGLPLYETGLLLQQVGLTP
ncbi:MAG: nucleoside triphosphate pyrophosphatase [Lautropia sp.]|nr:nucleoside triphosphate pyrophosphatase [Lautropia sp.]